MRAWWREHSTEVLLLLIAAFIVGLATWASMVNDCTHGRHQGTCGREYRKWVGKMQVTKTCDCVENHY